VTADAEDRGTAQQRTHVAELPKTWLQANRRLVSSVRRLMHAVGSTAASVQDQQRSEGLIIDASVILESRLRSGVLLGDFEMAEKSVASATRRIGDHNPSRLPLTITADGHTASATLTADALCEGPQGHLHGGLSAWLMDCMLGLLMESTGRQCVTANLDVNYRALTPLHRPLHLYAEIESISGRKVWANAWIDSAGTRTVQARGLFIEPVLSAR
jgi:hypothetical protein